MPEPLATTKPDFRGFPSPPVPSPALNAPGFSGILFSSP